MTSTAKPGESRDNGCTQGEMLVTVAAHCLLNSSTRVKGLAPASFRLEGPIVQLPCPEALYLGLERWAVTRNQLDVPEFRRFCRKIIAPYADLMEMLCRDGSRLRIVGLAASPSCGIYTTSSGYTGGRVHEQPHMHVACRGVFMEELLAELERRAVDYGAEEAGRKERTGLPIVAPGGDTVESRKYGIYIPRDFLLIYVFAYKSPSILDRNKFSLQPFGNLDQNASSGV
jgi:predicted secreted protein